MSGGLAAIVRASVILRRVLQGGGLASYLSLATFITFNVSIASS